MINIIENFKHKIGMNCLSTSLRDVVQYNGYEMDEDMCMGLSGAFSFWYSKSSKFMQATGVGNNIFEEFAAITKIQHHYMKFEDNDKAWEIACEYIHHGVPVLLDVEVAAYAQYLNSSEFERKKIANYQSTLGFRVGGHITCMVGYDNENAYLYENLKNKMVMIPIKKIKKARNPTDIEFVPPNNGMHVFYFPERLPDFDYMIDSAIIRVINNMELSYYKPKYCYGGLIYDCSGLRGIDMLFDNINDVYKIKDKIGICQLNALVQILNRWGGNEVNRAAYSRFLHQVSVRRQEKRLEIASQYYIELSKLWKEFLRKLSSCNVKNIVGYDGFVDEYKKLIMEKEKYALDCLHNVMKY